MTKGINGVGKLKYNFQIWFWYREREKLFGACPYERLGDKHWQSTVCKSSLQNLKFQVVKMIINDDSMHIKNFNWVGFLLFHNVGDIPRQIIINSKIVRPFSMRRLKQNKL